jgi:hypothetical protein
MKKVTSCLVILLLTNIFTIALYAQSVTITGNVKNSSTQENSSAVSVTIKGTDAGTFTDDKGNFSISAKSFPVTLVFSSVGYDPQEFTVKSATSKVNIALVPSNTLGQEVVVSASRVAERSLESAITIERVTAANIRNAPAAS